ncbi:MAG: Hsp20/alpha crystallin family protein [Cyanobacteria bacterium]|nr:Hsp20/alpha crystallin family protein [Cyanobacteria bacterium CG_2015-16_32_12]NCO78053.1 Hsp20/alpha crystallin family protein [Cyanobacteria bacterium CG_2015-22_32_23]NCQ05355.1 Hsp20/alpha crystallin family protein [Cyanobacteria bacterium CG_2015-09_32_10]NCQ43190.1 Hsp20/alpha crystallin family protein [Cyanobacteria bacterium CG_2015-04_32_10]NCS83722.1 Hsp20/alpha crystallin family protein [Cyanobacteria bacterium CG_2015-02_32_10]
MSLVRFYPLSDLNTLHRQMNRLFDEITAWDNTNNNTVLKPAVELFDNQDSLTLRVLIPGIDKKDLDISVTREAVKISGEYRHQEENKDNGYYVSEFNYGKFERTINLPVAIQNEKVIADYSDGILTLILPRVEEVKNKVFKVNFSDEINPTLEAN